MEQKIYEILDRMFTIYSHKDVHEIIASFITTLSSLVEEKDSYTSGHQQRTAKYCLIISEDYGLTTEQTENLFLAATVHDVGKVRVPSEILMRPKLMEVEMELIRQHPTIGANLLRKIKYFHDIPQIVEQHHERMDGKGYPRGFRGDEIRIEARILAVADVIDAMVSHRPYRPARSFEDTLIELDENKGIKYDKKVVECCAKIFVNKDNLVEDKE